MSWDSSTLDVRYGKTVEQVNQDGSLSVTYHQHFLPFTPNHIDDNLVTLRKHLSILVPCPGCHLHNAYYRDIRPSCMLIDVTLNLITFSVHGKSYQPPPLYGSLSRHYAISIKHFTTLQVEAFNIYKLTFHSQQPLGSIRIDSNLSTIAALPMPQNFHLIRVGLLGHNPSKDRLLHLAHTLRYSSHVEFFTDGLFSHHSAPSADGQGSHSQMGMGWIISSILPLDPSFIPLTYHAGTNLSPSSTKAECFALLLALLVCPPSCSIMINTDSANVITSFHTVMNPLTSDRKCLKISNHDMWKQIKFIITSSKLTVHFIKVKAHSGLTFNDLADVEARKGLDLPLYILILS